ncbi:type II toxin-antitoxin system RelE/ParE family toxin [Capnocytophaga bilenii]|uniref:type II toxin-antitoxin system RelE/ParE family toxin n=1 Tax=Capnocytophaga bilenii TaxID=2819369 RepID=UPI0028D471EC|nr:type II toxin-antitoxin system RelE/ParE family toxin [Capnocytophaga bilenii]
MKVFWTDRAEFEFKQTLAYWTIHNMSATYSNKILQETKILQKSLIESPYFLATYIEKIEAYRRVFFKGKFSVFYEVNEAEGIIRILRFRSSSQEPLY